MNALAVSERTGPDDPVFVTTLRVYAHTMRRSEAERERLKALVEGQEGCLQSIGAPGFEPGT
jgi:hypothetical protein